MHLGILTDGAFPITVATSTEQVVSSGRGGGAVSVEDWQIVTPEGKPLEMVVKSIEQSDEDHILIGINKVEES